MAQMGQVSNRPHSPALRSSSPCPSAAPKHRVNAPPMQTSTDAAEAAGAVAEAVARLDEVTVTAQAAHTKLRADLSAARDAARAELDMLAKRQMAAAAKVERAARALAVRAMELDNRALELERDEMALAERERKANECVVGVEEVERELKERENELKMKEASLKYSAVEQGRLMEWMKRLEEREQRLGVMEIREKERIEERVAMVVRRELLVSERERRVEGMVRERELRLARREEEVERVRADVEKERNEVRGELIKEREGFWRQQQRVSAIVAGEVEALLKEQDRLRTEFEREMREARSVVGDMKEDVRKMKSSMEQGVRERKAQAAEGELVKGLAALKFVGAEREGCETTAKADGEGQSTVQGKMGGNANGGVYLEADSERQADGELEVRETEPG